MLKVTQYERQRYDLKLRLCDSRSVLGALLGDRSGCGCGLGAGTDLVVAVPRAETCPRLETIILLGYQALRRKVG